MTLSRHALVRSLQLIMPEYRLLQLPLNGTYLICWPLKSSAVEIFISYGMSDQLVYMYVVSTAAIDMHRKFVQGIINWNKLLCRCSSVALGFLEGVFSTR